MRIHSGAMKKVSLMLVFLTLSALVATHLVAADDEPPEVVSRAEVEDLDEEAEGGFPCPVFEAVIKIAADRRTYMMYSDTADGDGDGDGEIIVDDDIMRSMLNFPGLTPKDLKEARNAMNEATCRALTLYVGGDRALRILSELGDEMQADSKAAAELEVDLEIVEGTNDLDENDFYDDDEDGDGDGDDGNVNARKRRMAKVKGVTKGLNKKHRKLQDVEISHFGRTKGKKHCPEPKYRPNYPKGRCYFDFIRRIVPRFINTRGPPIIPGPGRFDGDGDDGDANIQAQEPNDVEIAGHLIDRRVNRIRPDPDTVACFLFRKQFVEAVNEFFDVWCEDGRPRRICLSIVRLIVKLALLRVTRICERLEFQTSLINSAEIEAAYENTVSILHNIEMLRCPWGREGFGFDPRRGPQDFTLIGHGCNGLDEDCDCQVDECDEDKIPPTIALKPGRLLLECVLLCSMFVLISIGHLICLLKVVRYLKRHSGMNVKLLGGCMRTLK